MQNNNNNNEMRLNKKTKYDDKCHDDMKNKSKIVHATGVKRFP